MRSGYIRDQVKNFSKRGRGQGHVTPKSPDAKLERERECVEVKTVSPTHIRLTATTTKSAFCALHGLHEISIKLMRGRRYNSAEIFV